jgi:hypothetical protein
MLAHFLRPEGTGEAKFDRQQLIDARFSLTRIAPVPFRTFLFAKKPSPRRALIQGRRTMLNRETINHSIGLSEAIN